MYVCVYVCIQFQTGYHLKTPVSSPKRTVALTKRILKFGLAAMNREFEKLRTGALLYEHCWPVYSSPGPKSCPKQQIQGHTVHFVEGPGPRKQNRISQGNPEDCSFSFSGLKHLRDSLIHRNGGSSSSSRRINSLAQVCKCDTSSCDLNYSRSPCSCCVCTSACNNSSFPYSIALGYA